MAENKIAVIHSVEGGFQLGASPDTIAANVHTLAAKGVVYVTLAHLLWRRVATNAPAIPYFSDMQYRLLAPEPLEGLTALGRAAVTAMAKRGILIDITHMSDEAIWETFDLLRQLEDCHHPVPVIATHMACRFGHHEYNLSDATIKEVARRRGVMGVIFCMHWMSDGLIHPHTPGGTFHVIGRHIDRVHGLTNSYDHIAIGSDLDGFIKPVLPGLEHMGKMPALADWLRANYPSAAEAIMSGNVLRVLSEGWGRPLTNPGA